MNRETVECVLRAVGITDKQMGLVEKILSLENDKRVHSAQVYHGTIGYRGISIDVYLNEAFRTVEEFQHYLSGHSLPTEETQMRDGTCSLRAEGVLLRFFVPDSYPKC